MRIINLYERGRQMYHDNTWGIVLGSSVVGSLSILAGLFHLASSPSLTRYATPLNAAIAMIGILVASWAPMAGFFVYDRQVRASDRASELNAQRILAAMTPREQLMPVVVAGVLITEPVAVGVQGDLDTVVQGRRVDGAVAANTLLVAGHLQHAPGVPALNADS